MEGCSRRHRRRHRRCRRRRRSYRFGAMQSSLCRAFEPRLNMSPDQAAAAPDKAQKPERRTPRAHTRTRTPKTTRTMMKNVVNINNTSCTSAPPSTTVPPFRGTAVAKSGGRQMCFIFQLRLAPKTGLRLQQLGNNFQNYVICRG